MIPPMLLACPVCVDLMDRVVAVLDLAGDCFGCSRLVIRLRNSLDKTCIDPPYI